jgi:hypothetical protein
MANRGLGVGLEEKELFFCKIWEFLRFPGNEKEMERQENNRERFGKIIYKT